MFGEWDGPDVAAFWIAVGALVVAGLSAMFTSRLARRARLSAPDVAWTLTRPGRDCVLRSVGVRTARDVRVGGDDLIALPEMPFDLAPNAEVRFYEARGFGTDRGGLLVTWRSRWNRPRSWQTWMPDEPPSPPPRVKPVGER
jgi:hypothetical protein